MKSSQTSGPRPSVFGRLAADFFFFALAFLAYCLVVFIRSSSLDPGNTFDAVVRQNIGGASIALLLFLAVVVWRMGYYARSRQLAREHSFAVIFDTGRTKALGDVVRLVSSGQVGQARALPLGLTGVVDESGLALWGGWSDLDRLVILRWDDIRSLNVAEIAELGRRSRGIVVRTRIDGSDVDVPLIVTGGGVAGLFPKSRKEIEALIKRIEALRPTSSHASSS